MNPPQLPKALQEKLEAMVVMRYCKSSTAYRSFQHGQSDYFIDGARALFEVLLGQAPEFDEQAFASVWQPEKKNDDIHIAIQGGARWQHSQSQASIAALKADAAEYKREWESACERVKYRDERIAELEREVAEARKQPVAFRPPQNDQEIFMLLNHKLNAQTTKARAYREALEKCASVPALPDVAAEIAMAFVRAAARKG